MVWGLWLSMATYPAVLYKVLELDCRCLAYRDSNTLIRN
jgi:hypothetical protein